MISTIGRLKAVGISLMSNGRRKVDDRRVFSVKPDETQWSGTVAQG
jgi:hypothetical protein